MRKDAFFKIKKRYAFECNHIVETWFELMSYRSVSTITGCELGLKLVRKFKSLAAALHYCGCRGIDAEVEE